MDPHELIRPGQAQRLAAARRTAGREIGELAALLGISFEWYRDLESFDEEMVDTLSFDQLLKLCSSLGIEPRGFFDAHDLGHVTFAELADRLRNVTADGDAALARLEDEVGWELRTYLDAPDTFAELPAIALADIGAPLGVDWRTLLPASAAMPL